MAVWKTALYFEQLIPGNQAASMAGQSTIKTRPATTATMAMGRTNRRPSRRLDESTATSIEVSNCAG
jgi:hypothetical protein